MLRNKGFDESGTRTQQHLEISILNPILMTSSETKHIEQWWHKNVLKIQFVQETVSLIVHPFQ